jgi:putative addiction module component (TIGR02574 family)
MPLTNLAMAEEVLSLSPTERADLAKLLIQSLEGDRRTDQEIKVELARRLEQLKLGADASLSFEQVFESRLSHA